MSKHAPVAHGTENIRVPTANPSAPTALNHVALPCFDAAATHRFYTEVLGLRLVEAFSGRSAEWGNRDYLAVSFALASGESLTFFALGNTKRPADDGLPRDIRHIALTVRSRAESDAWQRRLRAQGVDFWTEDHGGAISIYVTDPNGHVIELTYDKLHVSASGERAAAAVVQKWLASRSGTKRKKVSQKGRG